MAIFSDSSRPIVLSLGPRPACPRSLMKESCRRTDLAACLFLVLRISVYEQSLESERQAADRRHPVARHGLAAGAGPRDHRPIIIALLLAYLVSLPVGWILHRTGWRRGPVVLMTRPS